MCKNTEIIAFHSVEYGLDYYNYSDNKIEILIFLIIKIKKNLNFRDITNKTQPYYTDFKLLKIYFTILYILLLKKIFSTFTILELRKATKSTQIISIVHLQKSVLKHMKKSLFSLLIFTAAYANAQVGINTNDPKATLDVNNTTEENLFDGIIAPRLTANELNSKTYTAEQTGAIIYVTSKIISTTENPVTASPQLINVKEIGYYYFDGEVWQTFKDKAWKTDGNTVENNVYYTDNSQVQMLNSLGINLDGASSSNIYYANLKGNLSSGNYLGSKNNQDLAFKTNDGYVGLINSNNISFGKGAFSKRLNVNKDGTVQTAAHNNNIIAIGNWALANNDGGNGNIGIGAETLISNKTGGNNIGIGVKTFQKITNTSNSIAIGFAALQNIGDTDIAGVNRLAANNTSVGVNSSRYIQKGTNNTALGMSAFQFPTAGERNTAIGGSALSGTQNANNIGSDNTAVGYLALANPFSENKGNNNTAIGTHSGINIKGNNNTFIGYQATYSINPGSVSTKPAEIVERSYSLNINNTIFGVDVSRPYEFNPNTGNYQGSGKIGIGVVDPEYRLDIAPTYVRSNTSNEDNTTNYTTTDPVRIKGVLNGTGEYLVITDEGVIKKTSTSPRNVQDQRIEELYEIIRALEQKIATLESRISE